MQPASSRRTGRSTSVWVLAMDALAAGLIVMVIGKLLHVVEAQRSAEALGLVILVLGTSACAVFVAGVL